MKPFKTYFFQKENVPKVVFNSKNSEACEKYAQPETTKKPASKGGFLEFFECFEATFTEAVPEHSAGSDLQWPKPAFQIGPTPEIVLAPHFPSQNRRRESSILLPSGY